jgi:hypothetical protein
MYEDKDADEQASRSLVHHPSIESLPEIQLSGCLPADFS